MAYVALILGQYKIAEQSKTSKNTNTNTVSSNIITTKIISNIVNNYIISTISIKDNILLCNSADYQIIDNPEVMNVFKQIVKDKTEHEQMILTINLLYYGEYIIQNSQIQDNNKIPIIRYFLNLKDNLNIQFYGNYNKYKFLPFVNQISPNNLPFINGFYNQNIINTMIMQLINNKTLLISISKTDKNIDYKSINPNIDDIYYNPSIEGTDIKFLDIYGKSSLTMIIYDYHIYKTKNIFSCLFVYNNDIHNIDLIEDYFGYVKFNDTHLFYTI
jgi:hypothetical protein